MVGELGKHRLNQAIEVNKTYEHRDTWGPWCQPRGTLGKTYSPILIMRKRQTHSNRGTFCEVTGQYFTKGSKL